MAVAPAKLLVVDDNEANRDMLSRRLSRRGHEVAVAEDGYQAIEMVKQQDFDVVLLDIMMPRIDGLEVLKVLRQTHSASELPIIMATARDESTDIVQALKLGASDYVTKPLAPRFPRGGGTGADSAFVEAGPGGARIGQSSHEGRLGGSGPRATRAATDDGFD
jgi:CheY-like chemotaxis protein